MPTWNSFLVKHPNSHLVIGWTRNPKRWRETSLSGPIAARRPVGRFAWKRDIDQNQSRYLLLAAFENESDARDFADLCGAKKVSRFSGYETQCEFALSAPLLRKLNARVSPKAEVL